MYQLCIVLCMKVNCIKHILDHSADSHSWCLVTFFPCSISLSRTQTAQRRIREIIQQVKQQEQKHQQGTSASAHPSKWPAGRLQRAPANECSPPKWTENYPDDGRGQRGDAGQTSSTNQKPKNFTREKTSESQRLRAPCALPAPREQTEFGEVVRIWNQKETAKKN